MNNRDAYNAWADTYDSVENKTRDLEARSLREVLADHRFENALEFGCGTGKNTSWLAAISTRLTAVDFSEEMMAKAKSKTAESNVAFVQADITSRWPFEAETFNLVVCSLILEHIEKLDHVYHQAARVLKPNGVFYVCELHPFKQYQGSKARFETVDGVRELECHVHHISDYFNAGTRNGFSCNDLREWFDGGNPTPRLASFLFKSNR